MLAEHSGPYRLMYHFDQPYLLQWKTHMSTMIIKSGKGYQQVFTPHDDGIKWKHFPRNWPFVRAIHQFPVNSPHKGQWRGALVFSLIYVWINDWVNNGEAGDLRRYLTHYDVTVMACFQILALVVHICYSWSGHSKWDQCSPSGVAQFAGGWWFETLSRQLWHHYNEYRRLFVQILICTIVRYKRYKV